MKFSIFWFILFNFNTKSCKFHEFQHYLSQHYLEKFSFHVFAFKAHLITFIWVYSNWILKLRVLSHFYDGNGITNTAFYMVILIKKTFRFLKLTTKTPRVKINVILHIMDDFEFCMDVAWNGSLYKYEECAKKKKIGWVYRFIDKKNEM